MTAAKLTELGGVLWKTLGFTRAGLHFCVSLLSLLSPRGPQKSDLGLAFSSDRGSHCVLLLDYPDIFPVASGGRRGLRLIGQLPWRGPLMLL